MYIYHIHTLKTTAFSGTFCEEDRNGCSEIQCFEGVECMDVPAPGVGAVCGSCPDGYTGDASKCYGEPPFSIIITKLYVIVYCCIMTLIFQILMNVN